MQGLEEIIFENRNKDYGSYQLRKKSNKYLFTGFLLSFVLIFLIVGSLFIIYNSDLFFASKMPKLAKGESIQTVDMLDLTLPDYPPPAAEKAPKEISKPLLVDSVQEKSKREVVPKKEASETNKDTVDKKGADTALSGKGNLPDGDSLIYVRVDELPEYIGGMEGLKRFLRVNISESAKKNKTRIKVKVVFTVTKSGETKDVSVMSGLDAAIDSEIMRVMHMLPKWKPARQSGRPVSVRESMLLNL
jgi:periplasmic protein TonB